jgi:membrane protease YdiL (CAAX protease family)
MEYSPATPPPGKPVPTIGGRPIEWTLRDVAVGLGLFVGLFVLNLIIAAPFVGFGDTSTEFYVASIITSGIWEVSLVVVAARLTFVKYGGSWERLGLKMPSWSTLGWAAAAVAATFAFAGGYTAILNAFDIDALKSSCDDQIPKELLNNETALIVTSIFAIAVAPVCEEIFFRGFGFSGFWRAWGLALGVIASALLFSVAHIGPSMHKTIIPILGIGCILALTYWRSGNLLSAILAHMANNIFAVIGLWTVDCN